MKRFSLILTLGLLAFVGCQKKPADGPSSDPVDVYFHVTSGSEIADVLYWAAFDSEGTPVVSGQTRTHAPGAFFYLTLERSQAYSFAFWSQNSTCQAYNLEEFATEGKVSVSYEGQANDVNRDAFFGFAHNVIITDANESVNVELTRPLAQLNFLANDYKSVEEISAHETLESSLIVSGLPSVLNCLDGTVEGSAVARFTSAPVIKDAYYDVEDQKQDIHGTYAVYGMNYVLAGEEKELQDVEVTFKHALSEKPIRVTVNNMPYKRNWKTNVISDFFTEIASIKVFVMNDFEDEDLPPLNPAE